MNKRRKSGETRGEGRGGEKGRKKRSAHSSCDATSCPLWWSRSVKWATNHQLPITELEEKQDLHTKEVAQMKTTQQRLTPAQFDDLHDIVPEGCQEDIV